MKTASLLVNIVVAATACGPDVYGAGELPASMTSLGEGEHSIVLVGDIMTWDRTAELIEAHGVGYPFEGTAQILQGADLTVGNLEGPVVTAAEARKGKYRYRVPPSTLRGLAQTGGFDLVSLANNHVTDCGRKGVTETISNLSARGMGAFGAGANRRRAERSAVRQVGDAKVAFLGFLAPETHVLEVEDLEKPGAPERVEEKLRKHMGVGEKKAGAVVASPEKVAELVREAGKTADLVVVFIHWGVRYHRPATEFQLQVASAAAKAGADLIVGHHAHFWQPAGVIEGVPVVFGTGNFAFGSANSRADEGLMVRAVLKGKRFDRVEIFPLYIKNRDSKVNYQPKVMRGADADEMLRRLAEGSSRYGAKVEVREGMGYIPLR